MERLIGEGHSNGQASKVKFAYFGLITFLVFCFTIAILVSVHRNGHQSESLLSRLEQIESDIKAVTVSPPASTTVSTPTDPSSVTTPSSPGTTALPTDVPSTTMSPPDTCGNIADKDKFDCHAENGTSEERCSARGCCWVDTGTPWSPQPTVPKCFFPESHNGYEETSRYEGDDRSIVNLRRKRASGLPGDIADVSVEVTGVDENNVRVRIFDPKNRRFEVPLPPLNLNTKRPRKTPNYAVTIDKALRLQISRVDTKTVIFDTELSKLIFSNQFLQLSSRVPSDYLYGLGEHRDVFRKKVDWKRYTMLNNDRNPVPDAPLYGTHPFYLMVEDDKANSHGVLLFNNNPMDIVLQPTPAVTYRTIGGIFDFFVYLGPSPSDVVRQHIGLVGKPDLPPYWGLGFHLCRWGYNSLNVTKDTMERNIAAGIPLDVQWNDIDYMDRFNDFTYDHDQFANLPGFVDDLHSRGMHYVQIFDPAVSGSEPEGEYAPYDEGLAMDIFVKNSSDQLFVGKVWNLKTSIFPDFTHPAAGRWWAKQLKRYMDIVKIDGAWIDMNDPANFFSGAIDARTSDPVGCDWNDPLEDPPYHPGDPEQLQRKTICFSNKHYIGPHYDVHNMYALFEAKATKEALLAITGKRQFIISRSTATGQGVYGMHWTGDIISDWDSMRWTIPSLMNFNMFGIPLVGADICGFKGNTTEELCARWQALGAFYPFSRNHNINDTIEQDPAIMGQTVIDSTKYSLGLRYAVLPYMYTLFYRASNYGDTVMRPLFFEFSDDKKTFEIEEQFMLGPSLMVVPALYENSTNVTAYFPKGLWYDDDGLLINSKGQTKELEIPLDRIVLARRGGSVITGHPVRQTTTAQRMEPFELSVYLDENKAAAGELFWDDGEAPSSLLLGTYSLVEYFVGDGHFKSVAYEAGYAGGMSARSVTVYGVDQEISNVTVNGKDFTSFTYENSKLVIGNLTLDLTADNELTWA